MTGNALESAVPYAWPRIVPGRERDDGPLDVHWIRPRGRVGIVLLFGRVRSEEKPGEDRGMGSTSRHATHRMIAVCQLIRPKGMAIRDRLDINGVSTAGCGI